MGLHLYAWTSCRTSSALNMGDAPVAVSGGITLDCLGFLGVSTCGGTPGVAIDERFRRRWCRASRPVPSEAFR